MKLLKFYAEWCGPCKAIAPFVNEVVQEKQIELKSIDVDTNSELANHYQVRSIPHLVLLDDSGQVLKTKSGMMSKKDLEEFLSV